MIKNIPTLIIALLLFVSGAFAQTNVSMTIHHKLGAENFEMNAAVQNNLGNNLQFTRFEYYLSEISLIHDGGIETPVTDHYLLVDAAEEMVSDLGDFNITNLEAIRFHVGVNEAANHGDPTLLHSSHPLSPQEPSMHWGWASGYRFAALEGYSGSDLSLLWHIHALVDQNYFQTEVPVELTASDGTIDLHLDADYLMALAEIDLSEGPIVHGGYGEAKLCLENFRDYVFSASDLSTPTNSLESFYNFTVYPNPSTPGAAQFVTTANSPEKYDVFVTDVVGRVIRSFTTEVTSDSPVNLNLEKPGIYFVQVRSTGQVITTLPLVIE